MQTEDRAAGWTASPPAGWEPVAAVCEAVFADLDDIVAAINSAIVERIPEFAPEVSAFTADGLRATTERNVGAFLHGIAENRIPDEEVLEYRRSVGRLAVRRGFPLQPLMASYLLAYRILWAQLIAAAETIGGEAPTMLLRAGETIWGWMHETTNTLALGYNKELADRDATGARVLAHLLGEIERSDASKEARALATSLGFDPDGCFRAIALTGSTASADASRRITAALQRPDAVAATTQRGRVSVVLAQGPTRDEVAAAIAAGRRGGIGVGSELTGLAGALTSVWEAEHALELAGRDEGIRWFEASWLPAVALRHRHLTAQLSSGAKLASAKPHLADAVRAFAGAGFSIAEGARALGVSEGSFRYRLGRWESLTGWSPLTFDGLARSMLALELVSPTRDDAS